MRLLPCFAVFPTLVCLLAGCGNKGKGTDFTRPTLVSIEPTRLAGVACGDQPGAMRAYVATVWDTTPYADAPAYPEADCEPICAVYDDSNGKVVERMSDEDCSALVAGTLSESKLPANTFAAYTVTCDWFQLPSSDLVPCHQPVGFSFIATGHAYVGRVDGYDRDDLVPFQTGSPIMTDPQTGKVVAPTWVWACTDQVPAVHNWNQPLKYCELLTQAGGTKQTAVRVEPSSFLGNRRCGNDGDEVATLVVSMDGDPGGSQSIACDAAAEFSPLQSERTYSFTVEAFTAQDETARWRTTCYADALAGVVTTATCDPLSDAS